MCSNSTTVWLFVFTVSNFYSIISGKDAFSASGKFKVLPFSQMLLIKWNLWNCMMIASIELCTFMILVLVILTHFEGHMGKLKNINKNTYMFLLWMWVSWEFALLCVSLYIIIITLTMFSYIFFYIYIICHISYITCVMSCPWLVSFSFIHEPV